MFPRVPVLLSSSGCRYKLGDLPYRAVRGDAGCGGLGSRRPWSRDDCPRRCGRRTSRRSGRPLRVVRGVPVCASRLAHTASASVRVTRRAQKHTQAGPCIRGVFARRSRRERRDARADAAAGDRSDLRDSSAATRARAGIRTTEEEALHAPHVTRRLTARACSRRALLLGLLLEQPQPVLKLGDAELQLVVVLPESEPELREEAVQGDPRALAQA